jgi:large subunit ribosomal protein L16
MEPERVTARQIEAARRAITRQMKRAGRVWIRVFPDVPVSKKPPKSAWARARVRRGILGGRVKPGRIMFEIDGVNRTWRQVKRFASAPRSCRSRRASSSAASTAKEHE